MNHDLQERLLSPEIRSRYLKNINGLRVHILEAGFEDGDKPCIILLHGFPELAFSWRKILPILGEDFHVVAPDQRGYGRTTGWDNTFDGDLWSFRLFNIVRDTLGLVEALGYKQVGIAGHDFGSPVAAYCALLRPDIFRAVVMLSHPFPGAPALLSTADDPIHQDLNNLPRPRKHYQWYYSSREANDNMHRPVQGLANFFRAYYHAKSADWPDNDPKPLESWSAQELQKLPTYYVMDRDLGMAETVKPMQPSTPQEVAAGHRWLSDDDLQVYVNEYQKNGFQGALQHYRCATDSGWHFTPELQIFAGKTIDVPALFLAGEKDWGIYQKPGSLEKMEKSACTEFKGTNLIKDAGHWVTQEAPETTAFLMNTFYNKYLVTS